MLKKILLSLLALILIIVIAGLAYYRLAIYKAPLISEKDRAAVSLMPLPAKLEMKSGVLKLSQGVEVLTKSENEIVLKSIVRFSSQLENIFQIKTGSQGIKIKVNCLKNNASDFPENGTDESYSLRIGNEIVLEANTQWGINHGFETLLQLIEKSENGFVIPKLKIEDAPRFPWRGLMLDVSRHWIPKEVVLRILDAMSAVKMNVFHWHLSDDQGFRVESKILTGLHEQGSDGKYYSQDEIREVVQFATDRGIRIVPEFDIPGHSKSWQVAYPAIGTTGETVALRPTDGQLFSPPLDPTNEEVYDFLDKLIGEMGALFPDPYFHIGGDEVDSKYWDNNPRIQEFMNANNLPDAHALQAYFNRRVQPLLEKHGKKMVGWQEILHPDLGKEIVIQSWIDQKSLFLGVQSGTSGILSAGWYLDHKLHAGTYYQVDPLVLPGAVDIEPDSSFWKSYDLKLGIGSNEIEGSLVLFDRNPEDVFGFFSLMNNLVPFRSGTLENGLLKLEFTTQMGKLKLEGNLLENELEGKISMGLLGMDCTGTLSGGSEMPGTHLPKIEVIKALSPEEQNRIMGGEAAQWAEVVGEKNVESRVWPSTAAIAEKLWSPAELTGNTDDMYRRLQTTSEYLGKRGSRHLLQSDAILQTLVPAEGLPVLQRLVSVLEEAKYYARLSTIMHEVNLYLPDLPLNGVVDATLPESFKARNFNLLTEKFAADQSENLRSEIILALKDWSTIDNELKPFITNDNLGTIAQISAGFSDVAKVLLEKIENGQIPDEAESGRLNEKIIFLENGENGMVLAVAPGLRTLLNL